MSVSVLSPRLLLCADLIPEGAYLADVGTDHAYLVIHLLRTGKIRRAVCSDINEGPLRRAKSNVGEAGLLEFVDFCLTDGAEELSRMGVDAYSICGMGGELIADIIARAPELKSEGVSLTLQPMTRHESLREFLWKSGFEIQREGYCREGGRYYTAWLVKYTGRVCDFTAAEAYFGRHQENPEALGSEELSYIRARARILASVIDGKKKGGEDTSSEEEILSSAKIYL